MKSRKCEISDVVVHKASYAKHLRSKKKFKNEKLIELIIPERLFQEPVENKIKKIYNPKSFKEIARENIKLNDKQMIKDLAKKMINTYFFTDRNLTVGFKIDLDTHHINHARSKLTITPNCPDFGIEIRYNKKIKKEFSAMYAILIYQNKFKYQTVFSERFGKQDEDNQLLDETELFISLNKNHI